MYTYLIGWTKYDKWYYGVRCCEKLLPSQDLWANYKSSSKAVLWMATIMGEPDVIEVRRVFQSEHAARSWEAKVLHRINAHYSDRWLNGIHNHVRADRKTRRVKPIPRKALTKSEREWNSLLRKLHRETKHIKKQTYSPEDMKQIIN